jgi:hypothetical protein
MTKFLFVFSQGPLWRNLRRTDHILPVAVPNDYRGLTSMKDRRARGP